MDVNRKVVELNIDDILPNRFQPRIKFNEESIIELSNSIKEHGVIQPLVVRKMADKYEIIAGERRYKASILAGLSKVPAIVTDLNDKDSAEVALIENIQRQNLTPIEEAISYKKILDMGYLTQESLANKLGKTQSTIANKLRLLNLDDDVQEALLEGKISERHARSILKLKDYSKQKEILNKIIKERLTVRRTDEEIDKMLNTLDKFNNDVEIIDFEEPIKENVEINNYTPIMDIPTNPIIPDYNQNSSVDNIDDNLFNFDVPNQTNNLEIKSGKFINYLDVDNNQSNLEPENYTPRKPFSFNDLYEEKKEEPIVNENKFFNFSQNMETNNLSKAIDIAKECQSKMEREGFFVKLEERDLNDIYQIVLTIEK